VATRWRATAAALICALHLAAFVPEIGEWSSVLVNDFAPQAQAINGGEKPYRDQDIEYPPLSLPFLIGPVYLDDSTQGFVDGFQWEMLAFDLGIVVLIAFGLPGDARRVLSALGIYTAGVLILSGVVLDSSLIDSAPLILARFDLVPALFVLAAIFARDRARSATWSALLSVAAAIKAFPLLLYPALLRGERNLVRVAVAGAIPILACAAFVLILGDEFSSAITYHTERTLQVESLAASPFEIAHVLGSGAHPVVGHGGFEVAAAGAGFARWASVVIGFGVFALVVYSGWRSPASNLELVSALLAVMIVFSPVLSPQFLLWLLPVSACAYGLGRQNAVLLTAFVLTQVALQHYDQAIDSFGGAFVWPLAVRNLCLLAYLWLVCAPIVREAPSGRGSRSEPPRSPLRADPRTSPSAR
jgi:hypothetical protein